MFTVSQEFRHRITSLWGEEGRKWLDRLPALVKTCAERWTLSVESPLPVMAYNFVAFAVTAGGTRAVLKIGVPNSELTTEIEAVRAFQGGPVARLLEADSQLGALLLMRVIPGTPLSELDDDEEASLIGARLIRQLPVPEPSHHHFPAVADWALAFDRLRTRFDGRTGPLPASMVDQAERLCDELRASSTGNMLLHGDLHHDNILYDGEKGWVVIDPKGVVGDRAYEAARFQHNPIPGFLSMDRPEEVVQRRVGILAPILQEDRSRLLAWAFFDAMLAACWSIEEGADDWQYFLSSARVLHDATARAGGG
jgi:streptomycin 6-kinase